MGKKKLVRRPNQSVTIYTDGSAYDGYGGAAAILVSSRGAEKVVTESFAPFYKKSKSQTRFSNITNQTMELMAVIIGLQSLKPPEPNPVFLREVTIVTDSAYVSNCYKEGWITNWRANGWKNYKGKPVANRELWETLDALVSMFDVIFKHVRGHRGHEMNERADELAVAARKKAVREA